MLSDSVHWISDVSKLNSLERSSEILLSKPVQRFDAAVG